VDSRGFEIIDFPDEGIDPFYGWVPFLDPWLYQNEEYMKSGDSFKVHSSDEAFTEMYSWSWVDEVRP